MRGSHNSNPEMEKLRAAAIRASRGESVDPAIVISSTDKDIASLVLRGDDHERAGLLRLLASVGARGRRIAEQALHEDCPIAAASGLQAFLSERFPEHDWNRAYGELVAATAAESTLAAARPLIDALPASLVKLWAERHADEPLRRKSDALRSLLLSSPSLLAPLLQPLLKDDPDPRAIEFMASMVGDDSPRVLRKAVRAALFRLGQRGIHVPEAGRIDSAGAERELESEAFISAIDPAGDQGVWILEELAEGGSRVLQAIIDEDGALNQVRAVVVEKRGRDQLRENISSGSGPPIGSLPVLEAMGILEAAFAANPTAVGKEYRAWRQASQADRRAVKVKLPSIASETRDDLVRASSRLLRHEACGAWLLTRAEAELAEKTVLENEKSAIILSEMEMAARRSDGIASAVRQIFGETHRRRLARRLEGTAIYLTRTGEEELAKAALATADVLRKDSGDYPAVLSAIIENSLKALASAREGENVRSGNESGAA